MEPDTAQAKLKRIHDSFRDAQAHLPAYGHMLPFFESLFTLQEAAVPVTSPESLNLTPGIQAARRAGALPVMDRSQLPYDEPAAVGLLQAICQEAETSTPELAAGAGLIKAELDKGGGSMERALRMFMGDDLQGIRELSARLSMDQSILLFFLYHSTWPSVARQTALIQEAHAIDPDWDHGYCPVCGSSPGLAFLAENGGRFLVCEFCRHQWPFKRILCPSCGSGDPETINYFFDEDEKTYRVYTCNACRTYIKTVDTRLLTRPFYPPLEGIVTAHFDLRAREMGYRELVSGAFRQPPR